LCFSCFFDCGYFQFLLDNGAVSLKNNIGIVPHKLSKQQSSGRRNSVQIMMQEVDEGDFKKLLGADSEDTGVTGDGIIDAFDTSGDGKVEEEK
jgi:hypothetical protein